MYIKVGDVNTRYWVQGSQGSTIILIHGLGGFIENWEYNISGLSQGHRVYALDLVGFGRSDKPKIGYSLPNLTEFVKEFMTVQDVDRATLIGLSMGGAIALRFALKNPNQVEKMVLVDSLGLGRDGSIFLRMMSLPIIGELLARPSRKGSSKILRSIFHNQDLITDQMIEVTYEMSSLPGAQSSFLSTLRSTCNIWGAKSDTYRPILDRLGEIEVPTLIIWGSQDKLLPVSHAHQAKKKLPKAKLHIFDSCGHVPNAEHAEEFNALVTDFLSKG
jgi:4,5:9,10-diseco-3-hydroxy-5,9,17-trioxoandrosta-1(10),2-diene-4-oate hydrolase